MLMYGKAENSKFCKDYVFSLTSMRQDIVKLTGLCPPNIVGYFDSYEFDVAYANYIMMTDAAFFELISIMRILHMGKDVYICVDEAEWSMDLVASLIKFIQQRYGYNAYEIHSEEDVFYASNQPADRIDPTFGIQNFDDDINRYSYLCHELSKRKMDPQYLLKYEDREKYWED